MKRVFEEISDDEWENHSFKPSRVLRSPQSPPPIESFAYGSSKPQVSDPTCGDDCVEVTENLAEKCFDLEDEDVVVEGTSTTANRGRRFVVDDEESDGDVKEVHEVKSSDAEEEDEDDEDLVGKALQKCAKISAELKGELFGSSRTVCDRYAEVEASTLRIVTQVLQAF